MEGIPQQDMLAHVQALESGQPSKRIKIDEPSPVELSSEEIKKQLAQHQAMMQGNPQGSQSYPYSTGFPPQQSMPSLMPHQYSQFYQRPAPSFQQPPFRSTVLPGQTLPAIPGQPWRPVAPVGTPSPLYGISSAYAPYSNGPSANPVPTSTGTSSATENNLQFDDTTNQLSTQSAQKSSSKVVLIYSDNEISMEEKRAKLEKYRYN
ncbi:3777_t:CDS:2 [Acaulospora colombiana]|uniref:3777_t:CDS:1 n=1 Tax=Acaulospora colombiana TaxID=27376 RepID=A0ACA9KBS6_9GLOM|nr:3777_t:CDS:2 [Acaulospora colombiana]